MLVDIENVAYVAALVFFIVANIGCAISGAKNNAHLLQITMSIVAAIMCALALAWRVLA